MHFNGVLILAVGALLLLLQEATAAEDGTASRKLTASNVSESLNSIADSIADSIDKPFEGIVLPDNALSIGFESIGIFLLLAGVVAFTAVFVLGVDKTAAQDFLSSASTAYLTPSTGYASSSSRYAQQETYNVHRNIDRAASKYQ
ncbi:uncharacterized protein [Cherax quadricarinatus]|uniref:uncharacterized protein isoform X2 n=1 Tax=Cherax quadricarinatus TaxID=27406 RepID=UPI00387E6523